MLFVLNILSDTDWFEWLGNRTV